MLLENETLKTINHRRSIRAYKAKQITDDELETVLDAGSSAPSGMNMQSAVAVAVKSTENMKKLIDLAKFVTGSNRNPFYDAPCVILVFSKKDNLAPVEDASLAIENMMIAADSLGLGSCFIWASKAMFMSADGKILKKEFGISDSYIIVGSLAVGYPSCGNPEKTARKSKFYKII